MSTTMANDKISEITGRIERLPLTSYQAKALMIIGTAIFFDAFDMLALAFALPALIGPWKIKPQLIGLMISVGFLGQMVGAIIFGRIAERYGRLRITVLAIFIYSIFSFCCAASWGYWSLFTFRLLQGLGLGGAVPVSATYVNEIIRAKSRGKFVMFFINLFPAGILVASFCGLFLVPRFGWQPLFVIGGIPFFIAIYLRWALPESPRWLASVGRKDEAEKAMVVIEKGVRKAFGADLPEPALIPAVEAPRRTSVKELFKGMYLKRTIMIWVIWFAAYFANYGISTWLPSLYKTVFKLPVAQSISYSIGTLSLGFLGSVVSTLLVDKLGRRNLIGGAFLVGGVLFIVLWLTGITTAQQVLVLGSLAFFFIFAVCTAVYLYTPELYPTRMRAVGTSIGSAWARIAAMVGPLFVGMVVGGYSVSWAFLLFGVTAVIGGLLTLLVGVETRGKVLEEISP